MSKQPKIIEIACVKLDEDLEIIGEFETLINPLEPLDEVITRITGITDEKLERKDTFERVYPELAEFFMGTDILCAHNLSFDRNLLTYELERLDKLRNFPWPIHHICTVEKSMKLEGYRLKLKDLYKIATGKEFVDAHRAMNDVKATVECFKYLVENGKI